MRRLTSKAKTEFETKGPNCPVLNQTVTDLSEYFAALKPLVTNANPYWFRGNSDFTYELIPSALRHKKQQERDVALNLVTDFRRLAEIKVDHRPENGDTLKWLQLAQHYGLDTRLLDWSENAAIALYLSLIHI